VTLRSDSTLARPIADRIGETIGRYRVGALIARGGVGAVYEVVDVDTGAERAMKMLLGGSGADAARFAREASATRWLSHPNVVEVIDLVAEGDALYLVMERLRGASLAEILERDGALEPRRALAITRQALGALGHAHARGVIHRDIKPANLMLEADDQVKLLDFGLVKLVGAAADELGDVRLTQIGAVFGTPAYLSPEQAAGLPVDPRTDLYSLGVVLFEMLTGRPPYTSPDRVTLVRMHAAAPIPPLAPGRPWCTPALEGLVTRALAKDRDARFGDAIAMLAALDAAAATLAFVA
jgi:eukaryotic-like serine/threonine-protein kinase